MQYYSNGPARRTGNTRQRKHGARFYIPVAVGVIVALVVVAILADSAVYYNKIHAGVSIAGTGVGGATRDEATAQLTELVSTTQNNPITITSGDKSWKLLPTEVGTEMDVAAAVEAAMNVSRDGNLFSNLIERFKLYFSGVDISLDGTVDEARLTEYIASLAADLDVPPIDAALEFTNGQVKIIEGQDGRVVDQQALSTTLKQVLLSLHNTEVTVPLVTKAPTVQAEDMQPAIEQANVMMSAPVTLTSGDKSWTITENQIGSFMDFRTKDVNGVSTLEPYLSADKMASFLDNIADDVATKAANATFATDGKKAWVVPAVSGKQLDPEKTAEAVTQAALSAMGRTAAVVLTEEEPDLTTAEAEAMGIKDLLASYTTPPYTGSENRRINVRLTTKYASDVILAPGEIYDFDKQIGPRTAARGYKTAPGIVGPGKMEDVFGGGICQVSTTLFNAAFFAGLEIVERHNHSIYINHYPKGRDATVSAGGPNLRFKNDTQHYILIKGTSDGVTTTFNIYGTSDGRKVTYTTSDFYNVVARTTVTVPNPSLGPGTTVVRTSGQNGKQCKVVRTITYADGTKKQQVFISTYPMVPKTIEVGTGTATTATTKPASTTTTTHSSTSTTGSQPTTTTTTTAPPSPTTTAAPPGDTPEP